MGHMIPPRFGCSVINYVISSDVEYRYDGGHLPRLEADEAMPTAIARSSQYEDHKPPALGRPASTQSIDSAS